MCTYCTMGDSWFRHDQPWPIKRTDPFYQQIPQPVVPVTQPAWSLEKLKEYLNVLQQVKRLEDELGCPCEPNKADYIGMFKKRIDALEKKVAEKGKRK